MVQVSNNLYTVIWLLFIVSSVKTNMPLTFGSAVYKSIVNGS